jgi:hypothetical protein
METTSFDKQKSIETIREMLEVSKRKFHSDGILMIVWGWIMTIHYMVMFVLGYLSLSAAIRHGIKYAITGLIFIGLAFTIYYVVKQRKNVQTYIGVSLRYVWVGMFFSLVLVNVIQFSVLKEINFELQHPIFMVIIAFATVVTGGILRYQLIIYGGISFALLALVSSRLPLESQMLMESIAWLIAFIIPGHILYSKRNRSHV